MVVNRKSVIASRLRLDKLFGHYDWQDGMAPLTISEVLSVIVQGRNKNSSWIGPAQYAENNCVHAGVDRCMSD